METVKWLITTHKKKIEKENRTFFTTPKWKQKVRISKEVIEVPVKVYYLSTDEWYSELQYTPSNWDRLFDTEQQAIDAWFERVGTVKKQPKDIFQEWQVIEESI